MAIALPVAHVQIVPVLLLRMYDPRQSTVFTPDELRRFVEFSKRAVNPDSLANFDLCTPTAIKANR